MTFACWTDGAHCFIENVTEELLPMTGAVPANRIAGTDGGQDQHGRAARVVATVAERCRFAGRQDKGRIVDELTATTGWHRKRAVRALSARAVAEGRFDGVGVASHAGAFDGQSQTGAYLTDTEPKKKETTPGRLGATEIIAGRRRPDADARRDLPLRQAAGLQPQHVP